MSYSHFDLPAISKKLGIEIREVSHLFGEIPEKKVSQTLQETLQENIPLALSVNTEKARSEWIISPMLLELRKTLQNQISLFSGVDFNVNKNLGLTGRCDFLISRAKEQLFIKAPVVAIVEAKNEDIPRGLGQCLAEMSAAKLFNDREGNEIKTIYGAVTTGDRWKFLKLEGKEGVIDFGEYSIVERLSKVFGILVYMVSS